MAEDPARWHALVEGEAVSKAWKRIAIDRIDTSGTQARVDVSPEHVDDLVAVIDALPPVTLVWDGHIHWIVDGYHRVAAHHKAGRKTVMADVTEGTREDAVWLACAANSQHGLRRSNADKRKAVRMALTHRQASELDMSDRAIAAHCHVSDHLVAEVRAELEQVRELAPGNDRSHLGVEPRRPRKGRDGKTYPKVPKAPKVPAEAREQAVTAPARVEVSGGSNRDATGAAIPAMLGESWQRLTARSNTIVDALRTARAGIAALKTLSGTNPRAMSSAQIDALHNFGAEVDALVVRAQAYRPHAVCGCGGEGCSRCKGRGWLSERDHKALSRENA